MNYPNLKKKKLTHKIIAKMFGYKNVNSFNCSSANKRIMQGIEEVVIYLSNTEKEKETK